MRWWNMKREKRSLRWREKDKDVEETEKKKGVVKRYREKMKKKCTKMGKVGGKRGE